VLTVSLFAALLLQASPLPDAEAGHAPGTSLGGVVRSLGVPGWGQLHSERAVGWVYLGAEAVTWAAFAHHRREAGSARSAYRDLAWEVARTPPLGVARRDGDWGYYERMSQWTASGRYNRNLDAGDFRPETDASTYNGALWKLAREIYLPPDGPGLGDPGPGDPRWDRALAYYQARAVPSEFEWDWGDERGAWSRFRSLILDSDRAYRTSTTWVGVAMLNRFVSAAEQWVASQRWASSPPPLQIRTHPDPHGGAWIHFSLPLLAPGQPPAPRP
jgi:hypothetical protein